MYQTWETERALREHHLPNMRQELKRALLLRCLSRTVAEIAESEVTSESTVRRRLDKAGSEIFDTLPLLIPRGSKAEGFWVGSHLVCCLEDAAALMRPSEAGTG